MIKQFDNVEVIVDKTFLSPKCIIKKGSTGTVTDILKDNEGRIGFLVEINNRVYDFEENEIKTIN